MTSRPSDSPAMGRQLNHDMRNERPLGPARTKMMQTGQVVRMPSRIPGNDHMATATARAASKEEALRLVGSGGIVVVELDYESGWQDAVELGRLGRAVGVRVEDQRTSV